MGYPAQVNSGFTADAGTGIAAVTVTDLVKRYPKASVNAVDGISFSVDRGEVFGLLGPNGAGKTTTVGALTTRVRPTSGKVMVAGVDVVRDSVRARSRLAVVPQHSNLDRSISIRRNLIFHAAYHGVGSAEAAARTDVLLEQFGLDDRAHFKPDLFSGGQEKRVMIARALMHDPEVLFLDEPSSGLDPAARLFVWDRLRELRDRGVTLILTTHDMHEAAMLVDTVAIVDHGKLLARDSPTALIRSLPGQSTLELSTRVCDSDLRTRLVGTLGELADVVTVEQIHDPGDALQAAEDPHELRLRLYAAGDAAALVAPVATSLAGHDLRLTSVTLGSPTLEDVFIHLTGRGLR